MDTQVFLTRAPALAHEPTPEELGTLRLRWAEHRRRVEEIRERTARLYRRGDPLGTAALLSDIATIERHLRGQAEHWGARRPDAGTGEEIVHEDFSSIDESRWLVLGRPRAAGGALETSAPGGWENYCGVATRRSFELHPHRPLVVEFDVTPVEMGIDSQLFAACDPAGAVTYRFSFYGPTSRFGVYTKSSSGLRGAWVDPAPGWHLRSLSQGIELGKAYHVGAEITRNTFRVTVAEPGRDPSELPLWDTGPVPMDELPHTHLLFADVEPEGGTAASRWGSIRVYRPAGPTP